MIISLRSVKYEELKKMLNKEDKIVVWSCDTCIKYCGLGGVEKAKTLAELLKEDGYNVLGVEIISESCHLDLIRSHKKTKKDMLDEATAIIVLACEDGVHSVKNIFKEKKIINVVKTLGVGNLTARGEAILVGPFEWTGLKESVEGYTLNELAEKLNLYNSFFDEDKKPKPKLVKITVDGKEHEAEEGKNLLEALLSLGYDIPHLCHRPGLNPASACRLCLVEIEGMRGLVPSCHVTVKEGMNIKVETEELKKYRRTILEIILAEVGEKYIDRRSELAVMLRKYGVKKSRFTLSKKEKNVDESGDIFIVDNNKCVLCGRCVRTCEEISGRGVLDFGYRGEKTQIVSGLHDPMKETNCVGCLACVNACPANALSLKTILFDLKPVNK